MKENKNWKVKLHKEKHEMKGLLGGLAWRANQTAPWLNATTSILQGHNRSATVKEVLQANKLCRLQRAKAEVGLKFSHEIRDPMVLSFTDASHANRADGSSQGGSITLLTDRKVLDGHVAPFSVLSWHSRKLKRLARSSTCAEVQECANTCNEVEFVKQVMYEILHEQGIKARNSDECVASIPAAVVCDAKNLYDSVKRVVSSGLQMEENRLSLEILNIKERTETTNTDLKWTDSDQQRADDLTKIFEVDKLLDMIQRGVVVISWDSKFISAKRKRRERSSAKESEASGHVEQEENFIDVVLSLLPQHVMSANAI